MNGLDIAIGVIILASTLIGLMRGFVREALSLVSWILAFWIAWFYAQPASGLFEELLNNASLQVIVAFTTLFLATLVVASLLSHLLHKVVTRIGLAGPDRGLGLLFGSLRGGVIVAVVILLMRTTPLPAESWWQESMLVGYFERGAVLMLSLLPAEVAERFSYR